MAGRLLTILIRMAIVFVVVWAALTIYAAWAGTAGIE